MLSVNHYNSKYHPLKEQSNDKSTDNVHLQPRLNLEYTPQTISCPSFNVLNSIDFIGIALTGQNFIQIRNLINTSKLKFLKFAYNNIEEENLITIFEAMRNNTTIKYFTLGFNFRIDMKVGEKIKSFLSHNSTIKELSLHQNNIGDDVLKLIMKGIRKNSSLNYLSLQGNSISSEGVKYIERALLRNNTLLYLDLRSNFIDVQGVDIITKCISQNDSNIIVDLSYNTYKLPGESPFSKFLLDKHYFTSPVSSLFVNSVF